MLHGEMMQNSISAIVIVLLAGFTLAGCGGKSSAFKYVVVCDGEGSSNCGERYLTTGFIEEAAPTRAVPAPPSVTGIPNPLL
jgi:hypothetical protein